MRRTSRSEEKRRQIGLWKKIVPVAVLGVVLFALMPVSGFGYKEEAASLKEGGAVRVAGQVQQESEAGDSQRNKAEEQADGADVLQRSPQDKVIQDAAEADKDVRETVKEKEASGYDFVLSFAGDICFDETCDVMQNYIAQGEELEHNISPELLDLMRGADVCWINNEFAYSDRGAPLANKMYTFRAKPERVQMLKEMGVDIAGLANNHVYDFGPEAMTDTFDTLRTAGIDYVGAGKDLEEATTPVYREIDGIKDRKSVV